MRLIILGAPGSGKGTQARALSRELSLPHISTGDILREAIRKNTPLGQKAKIFVEEGKLVPDKLVTELVTERLSSPDLKTGFILDGFPRNINQAEDLDRFLTELKSCDYLAVCLKANEETIIKRLSGRRICRNCQAVYHLTNLPPKMADICDHCGGELYQRSDDKVGTIRKRLQVYEQETAVLINYYSKLRRFVAVPAEGDAGTVLKDLLKITGGGRRFKVSS